MTHYGVRRLILLNSGNYIKADVTLTHPIHLSASNNRGKSTLVNSLQFLFIADPSKMRFGTRNLDDSLKHYFGESRSFIVYECQTPTGIQCMMIRGRGSLGGNRFERYIYDSEFNEADFINEDRQILEFESVRERLADRHLTAVKRSELWNVLAADAPASSGGSSPRLGLLPIKRRDQYVAFCDVFVRLLSLQSTDARALRQLIIQSLASDISEQRIDVAGEYREDFERAGRAEHELAFMRAAGDAVDEGETLRQKKAGILELLQQAQTALRQESDECRRQLAGHAAAITSELDRLQQEAMKLSGQRDSTIDLRGQQRAKASDLQAKWDALQESRKRWESTSEDFIVQMRRRAEDLNRDCILKQQQLSEAEQFNLPALRRQVDDLQQQVEAHQQYIASAEKTLIASLRASGLEEAAIEKLVQIVNADLFKLVVGESVAIENADGLIDRARRLASQIQDEHYSDDCVSVDLRSVGRVDTATLFDVEATKARLQIDQTRLRNEQSRLAVADDQEAAKVELKKMEADLAEKRSELAEYDQYATDWEQREQLSSSLSQANEAVNETEKKLSDIDANIRSNGDDTKEQSDASSQVENQLKALNEAAIAFRHATLPYGLVASSTTSVSDTSRLSDQESLEELLALASSLVKQLKARTQEASELDSIANKLGQLQQRITQFAVEHESTPRYFSDAEQEWQELVESRLAAQDMEAAAQNAWDALFTPLAARMNGIVNSVRTIKRAVEGIRRSLKSYQVSNLAEVDISVEETPDTFEDIVTLSEPSGLFTDHDKLDIAKKRLQQMIAAGRVIDLESLFEIKIGIEDAGGTKRRAASLDEIGSTGTGMTVKAMIFVQLIRAIASDEAFRLHFYIDGLGELDDDNLSATAALAVSKGILPITADPRVHLEPLAHPEVTVYSLGQYESGHFYIDNTRTYHARRQPAPDSGNNNDA